MRGYAARPVPVPVLVLIVARLPRRADRVALLFCGTHKTVAMGIPLLNTIFEDNPKLGIFVVPLLLWHPLQLLVGSLAATRIAKWVEAEDVPRNEEA